MTEFNYDIINDAQYDVLKELGNIGAGNATTALSQLLNTKIDMTVPMVKLLNISEISDIVGGPETLVVGILFTLELDVEGMMMFMLDQSSAQYLVNTLLGRGSDDISNFTEMELSALKEIGNIIAGAYLSSLSKLTGMSISESIPYMSIDMAGAILSVPAIEFGKMGDKALLIQSQFCEDDTEVNGYFILIPTEKSYSRILYSLGM